MDRGRAGRRIRRRNPRQQKIKQENMTKWGKLEDRKGYCVEKEEGLTQEEEKMWISMSALTSCLEEITKKKKKTHIKLCCVLFKDYSAASLMKKGKRGEIQGKRGSPRPSTNDPKIQPRGAFICCERGLGGFKPRPAGFSSCCWKGLRCRALPEKGFAINRDWIQLASCKTDC